MTVDAAADDDEAHAHRDDADERGAREHVHRVVDGGEVVVQREAGDAQHDQAQHGAEPVQARPRMARAGDAALARARRRHLSGFRWRGQ
jgi:hypothetical protein